MSAHQESAVSAAQAAGRPSRAARLASLLEQDGLLVMALAAFAIALITHLRVALTVDGWMALLSGREVAQHGLPTHDMLTVWAHGRQWVDQQWLAQLVLYELERLAGLRLVLLFHAALVAGALAAAAALARRTGASTRSVTWIGLPVIVTFWRSAAVMRPQTFSYVLFVGVLWLLLDDLRTPSRRVYWVLPLLVLWANLHGSVVVGAALVSAYAMVEIARSLRIRPRPVRGRLLVLLAVPWLCVLASPYATSLPTYYREILLSSGFGNFVTEWAPTTLTAWAAPLYLIVVGGIWLLGRVSEGASAFEKVTFVGLTLLAFTAVRNSVWLALLGLVVLPRLVDALRAPAVEPKRLNRLLATAMLVGVVVATAGVAAKSVAWFTNDFPAAASVAAAKAAGTNAKVFASERYADWLIWGHPELAGRVAYDSRFELLTHAQLQSVVDFRSRAGNWTATVRGYRVLVLDRVADREPEKALLRAGLARVVRVDGDVVVLRHMPGR